MKKKKNGFVQNKDFVRGARAAANVAGEYDSSTTHPYRLEDCILCKLNVISREKPRKNRRRLPKTSDVFMIGFAVALADLHRRVHAESGPNLRRSIDEHLRVIAKDAGLTLTVAKSIRVAPSALRELKLAGVAFA